VWEKEKGDNNGVNIIEILLRKGVKKDYYRWGEFLSQSIR
jgi:hypothetical protein